MNKDFFVVDFEFTQFTSPVGKPRAFFPEIIEIGGVRVDCLTHEITGEIEEFVKPHFFPNQAAESMAFCMITESDMENAIEFGEMLEQMKSLYVPGKTYFVSWGNADFHVVKQGCERHAIENPILQEDYLDLAETYKLILGEKNTPGLRRAIEDFGIDAVGFGHTAYDDAVNTSKVLLKLIADGWQPC